MEGTFPTHPQPAIEQLTLGDLIGAVDEYAETTEETLAVVDHLFRTGRVRILRGSRAIAGARIVVPPMREGEQPTSLRARATPMPLRCVVDTP